MSNQGSGVTLIELPILVGLVAVLAAIAVPNYLEAQTRAKVSRTLNDQRVIAMAEAAYFVDNNEYTRDGDSSLDLPDVGAAAADPSHPDFSQCANGALQLTTPVAYMTTMRTDPFARKVQAQGVATTSGYRIGSGTWSYANPPANPVDHQNSHLTFSLVGKRPSYVLIGVGPDADGARIGHKNFPFMSLYEGGASTACKPDAYPPQPLCYTTYDPTNGTVSIGDIYRFGGSYWDGRYMIDGKVVGALSSPAPGVVW